MKTPTPPRRVPLHGARAYAATLPPPIPAGTIAMFDLDAIRSAGTHCAHDISALMEVYGAEGRGWKVRLDHRPMGSLVVEGINGRGHRVFVPCDPKTLWVDSSAK